MKLRIPQSLVPTLKVELVLTREAQDKGSIYLDACRLQIDSCRAWQSQFSLRRILGTIGKLQAKILRILYLAGQTFCLTLGCRRVK
jgi:hypothetical protein